MLLTELPVHVDHRGVVATADGVPDLGLSMIASCSEVAGWLGPHRRVISPTVRLTPVGEQRHDPLTAVAGQSFDNSSSRLIQDRRPGRAFPCPHGNTVSAASDMHGPDNPLHHSDPDIIPRRDRRPAPTCRRSSIYFFRRK
jgi:hypothetical protein